MKYKTKSVIIGRKKKDKEDVLFRPCFIALFDLNDPHKANEVPKEIIEIKKAKRIDIIDFKLKFMLMGGDIVINDLKWIEVQEENGNVRITG